MCVYQNNRDFSVGESLFFVGGIDKKFVVEEGEGATNGQRTQLERGADRRVHADPLSFIVFFDLENQC